MSTVAIIDYGMGNLHSIAKALEHVADKARIVVSQETGTILSADRVVFPGVGAIGYCMDELQRLGLDEVVRKVAVNTPLLGVCLGMQAMLDASEENDGTTCLSLIPGDVRRFPESLTEAVNGKRLKIPHMGWNTVHQNEHSLWSGIEQDSRFYFVHSYHAKPANTGHVAGTTDYGAPFTSVIARDNLFAVQFHPEKSQIAGLKLLQNFVAWDGQSA